MITIMITFNGGVYTILSLIEFAWGKNSGTERVEPSDQNNEMPSFQTGIYNTLI